MSKMFHVLSVMAMIGVGGLSHPTNAGNLPARGGKSDLSEPGCWGLNGPSIQNNCNQGKLWYMPLTSIGAGTFTVTVTAQAASNSSNVQCVSTGANREATSFSQSVWIPLPQFGAARDINLVTTVPWGGTGMVDCYVLPGGRLHTLSW
jgi:hypothetical protein